MKKIREIHFFDRGRPCGILPIMETTEEEVVRLAIYYHERDGHTWEYKEPQTGGDEDGNRTGV